MTYTHRLILENFRNELRLGDAQENMNMLILPVLAPAYDEPEYITSDQALKKGCLVIREVSEGGSVPYLKAVNKCGKKIFLPEGDEIKGAKQNRTFNTSILLPEYSETIIPVSCTEQGRWNYNNDKFSSTDSWVPSELRQKKVRSVSESIRIQKDYHANQIEVWNSVDDYANIVNLRSNTKALRDVLKKQNQQLEKKLSSFPIQNNQTGIVVFINGMLHGIDVVTHPAVFEQLYPKILKSYLIDAELKLKSKLTLDEFPELGKKYFLDFYTDERFEEDNGVSQFNELMDDILAGNIFANKSPGLGTDIRINTQKSQGFALSYGEKVIHFVLFRNTRAN